MEKENSAIETTNNKKPKFFYYILTGILAGFINGLFGGGGGMIVVPMLVLLLKKHPKIAHATAILIILPLSLVSGIFYAIFGSFDLAQGIPTSVGVIIGGVLGALLLSKLSSKWIMIIFSVAMAIAGVKMLFF
ncbi:MAG: sulfite exporter TauE/SafE family protein [Clostridia bacterium]|nr:sulfite exporter TauE/SafE family protein [Clostridia bacterium]